MAEASTKVVYAALVGNVLVALCKSGAAFLSGSSAMLTEAIHSTADTVNQLLLLVGNNRSRRRKDASHAFGCSHDGKMIGGLGLAEVFSFHASIENE